jgi:tetratricopeptide (TPR) repeat protein
LRCRFLLPVITFPLICFACSTQRLVLQPPFKTDDDAAQLVETGDVYLRQGHLYAWRHAETHYRRADQLRNTTETRDRLALTQFLIITREVDERILSDQHLARLSSLCSRTFSSRQVALCRAARTRLRLARILNESPWAYESDLVLYSTQSDQRELNEYVVLLIARDSAALSYPERVARFSSDFPHSPLSLYLKIGKEGPGSVSTTHFEAHTEFAELYIAQGADLLDKGNFERGIRLLQQGLTLIPDHTSALVKLAGTYLFSLGLPELALKYYDRAISFDPKCVEASFGRAVSLHLLRDYVGSNQVIDQMLNPESTRWITVRRTDHSYYRGQAYYLKSYNLYKLGQLPKARHWISRALLEQPHSEAVQYLSGVLYFEEGNVEASRQEFLSLADRQTEICDVYYRLAILDQEPTRSRCYFTETGSCLERQVNGAEARLREASSLEVDPLLWEKLNAVRQLQLQTLRADAVSSIGIILNRVRESPALCTNAFLIFMTDLLSRLQGTEQ